MTGECSWALGAPILIPLGVLLKSAGISLDDDNIEYSTWMKSVVQTIKHNNAKLVHTGDDILAHPSTYRITGAEMVISMELHNQVCLLCECKDVT